MWAVCGEGAVTDRTCQQWFVKFCAGGFSMVDAPHSGRPAEVESDQIQTAIENNQHCIMWEIADILKIHKSIKLSVKMKCVFCFMEKSKQTFSQPNKMD